MPIPKHDEIRIPALKMLKEKGTLKLKDFVELLAAAFKLTEEELSEMYPSGNGRIFYDRVTWALSYLHMAALVDRPNRGYYQINDSGLKMLATPDKVHEYIDERIREREPIESTATKKGISVIENESSN